MEEIKEISGFCTIDEIVLEVQNDVGDPADMSQHFRFAQWCVRGFGELRKFALPVGKEIRRKIDPKTSAITIPDDFFQWGDIGIYVGDIFWSFTEKPEMKSIIDENCGEDEMDLKLHSEFVGRYAESGGKNRFYYKKDMHHNRVIVYAKGLTEVILKYISTGIKVSGNTLIPLIAKEALIAWIHWQIELARGAGSASELSRKMIWGSYFKALRTPRNLTALYDALYSTIKQTAKR